MVTSSIQPWAIQEKQAELSLNGVSGSLDTARPNEGLRSLTQGAEKLVTQLFGVVSPSGQPWEPTEQYVRQPDLVCHYGIDTTDHVSRSLYWRVTNQPDVGTSRTQIELIVSLQTDRLDTNPRVELLTQIPPDCSILAKALHGGESDWSEIASTENSSPHHRPTLFVLRPCDTPWSLAFTAAANDWASGQVIPHGESNQTKIRLELVDTPLEKGVIRRYRAAALVLDRQDDLDASLAWEQQFNGAAPPLTT